MGENNDLMSENGDLTSSTRVCFPFQCWIQCIWLGYDYVLYYMTSYPD